LITPGWQIGSCGSMRVSRSSSRVCAATMRSAAWEPRLREAGGQEGFRAVDQDLVLKIARVAQAAGAERLVSSRRWVPVKLRRNFYLRVKGETEPRARADAVRCARHHAAVRAVRAAPRRSAASNSWRRWCSGASFRCSRNPGAFPGDGSRRSGGGHAGARAAAAAGSIDTPRRSCVRSPLAGVRQSARL